MKKSLKKVYRNILNEDVAQVKHIDITGVKKVKTYEIDNFDDFERYIDDLYRNNVQEQSPEDEELLKIASKFSNIEYADLLVLKKACLGKDANFKFRIQPDDDNAIVNHLNRYFKQFTVGANKTVSRIGPGEVSVNLAFETTNWNTKEEPDAVIQMSNGSLKKVSCKSFAETSESLGGLSRGEAMTGQSDTANKIRTKMVEIKNLLITYDTNISTQETIKTDDVVEIIKQIGLNSTSPLIKKLKTRKFINDLKSLIIKLKEEILREHDTDFILVWDGIQFSKTNDINDFGITNLNFKQLRTSFCFMKAYSEDAGDHISTEYFITPDDLFQYLSENIKGFKEALNPTDKIDRSRWPFFKDLGELVYKDKPRVTIMNANAFYDRYIKNEKVKDNNGKDLFKIEGSVIDITKKTDDNPSGYNLTKGGFSSMIRDAIKAIESSGRKRYAFYKTRSKKPNKIFEKVLDEQIKLIGEGIKSKSLLEVYSNLYNLKKNIT